MKPILSLILGTDKFQESKKDYETTLARFAKIMALLLDTRVSGQKIDADVKELVELESKITKVSSLLLLYRLLILPFVYNIF